MALTYTLIKSELLLSNTAYVEFTAIPASYTHLKIIVSSRNTSSDTGIGITFNSTTSGYTQQRWYGQGTGITSADLAGTNSVYMIASNDSSFTAGIFSNSEINISRYTAAQTKSVLSTGTTENIATTALAMLNATKWADSNPISTIRLTSLGTSFLTNSSFYLYGI
jgi:hypothetical protein